MSEQTYQQAVDCQQRGALSEAERLYRAVLSQRPGDAVCLGKLGNLLMLQGRLDEAIAAYEQALRAAPQTATLHYNLGVALQARNDLAGAESRYRRALELDPGFVQVYNNLGNVLKTTGRMDEALACYGQAVRLAPGFAMAWDNLGDAHFLSGRIDEALACSRRAMALEPENPGIHGNYLASLQFHPDCDAARLRAELRRWRDKFADPLKVEIQPHANDRSPERRLRVGYVSPDFRAHCQSLFTIPLLAHHDHTAFEVFCYSSVECPDDHTRRIAGYADVWRDVHALHDAALGALIRADRIDILVDLTMHMVGGRPLLFARKPAPVQAAWLAYPGSTGLDTIDYRLTDPYLDPPEPGVDAMYAEKSLRLPATFWCYDPLDDAPPAVSPLPALANGYVTFGCLNNFCKVNEGVLKLWAQAMAGVAGSRLIILAEAGQHRERALTVLEGLGVSRQRVRFEAKRPRPEYLKLYHQIDIGLDTLPYNGHTTSLDSYFMGVPVVTLVGKTVVGRAGLSQLTNLDMPELIARTPEQYVYIAHGLASDLERLANLRATLRARMLASPLMDAPRFARNLEAAYRQIWCQWCATPPR